MERTLTIQEFFKSPTDQFDIHLHSQKKHGFPHKHDYVEILYVVRGSLSQTINGNEITLQQGECCLMDLHSVHHIHSVSPGAQILQLGMQKTFFNYHFNEVMQYIPGETFLTNYLDAMLAENIAREYLLFHSGSNQALRETLLHILDEYTNPDFCSIPALLSNIYLMFFELFRVEKDGLMEQFQDDNPSQGLTLVLNYISRNCASCTLADTARFFGYSSGYLGQLLKDRYDKTFQDIRMEFRLLKSARLLAHTIKSVSDIATAVGYQNQSYFYRIFRQQFGVTPQEYRELPMEKRIISGHKLLALGLIDNLDNNTTAEE